MVVLRPTQKLRALLPLTTGSVGESETALGDWYINRIVVDRRPLLLLLSAQALLPLLIPARDVRSLPDRLPGLVGTLLRRLGVGERLIEAELRAMETTCIAPTRDRSVLGVLVDTAKSIPHYLDAGRWDETTLPLVEGKLANTPWHCSGRSSDVVWPAEAAPRLLHEKWGGG